jgi:hypothetical protein
VAGASRLSPTVVIVILAWLAGLTGIMVGMAVVGLELLDGVPLSAALIAGGKAASGAVVGQAAVTGAILGLRALRR